MRLVANRLDTLKSSFLSCEKDAETIIKKLFVSSGEQGEALKRLLVVNTKDCLDNPNQKYDEAMKKLSVKELLEGKYITLVPRIQFKEHEEVKSHIVISFDQFSETNNPEFRDCVISFDILCHTDSWDLGDYRMRPLKIAGIIDGILNNTKLSGIGELNFLSCRQIVLNEELSGYTLLYVATHGGDDRVAWE